VSFQSRKYSVFDRTNQRIRSCSLSATLAAIGFHACLIALLCSSGCTDAQADAQAESQTASTQQPDMSLKNYDAGCSTVGCHQQLSAMRWVHAPISTNDCSACHELIKDSTDNLTDNSTGNPSEHLFKPVVTDGSTCKACHSFDQSPISSHEPFDLGTCHDCHDPHGGDRKSFINTESTQALCAKCHDPVAMEFEHHPVTSGDCLTCHQPHQSNHPNLLVQNQETLCYGCHQDMDHAGVLSGSPMTQGQTNVHEPMYTQGCTACHSTHGSDIAGMLLKDQRSMCLGCHEQVVEDLPQAMSVHGAFQGELACTQCHVPHASEYDGLLTVDSSALCYTCHDQPIETQSGRTLQSMKELVEKSPVVHEPVALGQCTACHASHFSSHQSLLLENYPNSDYEQYAPGIYASCTECHDKALVESQFTTLTGFRDGDQNLHYVHTNQKKGRSCGMCHQPHAGSLPKLMREQFPFGPGQWDLQIGFVQSKTGGTCMSACHEKRTYNNSDMP